MQKITNEAENFTSNLHIAQKKITELETLISVQVAPQQIELNQTDGTEEPDLTDYKTQPKYFSKIIDEPKNECEECQNKLKEIAELKAQVKVVEGQRNELKRKLNTQGAIAKRQPFP